MRVLQVSDGYPPATGGLERTVQALAKELADRGHPTMVATLSVPDAPPVEWENTAGTAVEIRRLEGFSRHLQRFSADPGHHFHPTTVDWQLVRRLEELIAEFRPDVVHAHGWILNSCLSLRLPDSVALVTTLHDYSIVCPRKTLVFHDQLDTRCSGPGLGKCLRCASQFYGPAKGTVLTLGLRERTHRLDRVSLFLPISRAVADASLPGMSEDRYAIVPSFVPDDVAAEAVSVPRPEFLPDGDFVIFVGALGEHKGIGLLAEAQRRMRNPIPLVAIGSARADTPVLEGSAERPVIMHTGIPHDQIMAAYAAATIAAVPSRWAEPLGLVAVEAMAVGLPVVATRVGALPEVVLDGVTGLIVEPGDADELAAALDRLVEDPPLRARLGAAGAVRAAEYSAGTVIPEMLAAYERALGARVAHR